MVRAARERAVLRLSKYEPWPQAGALHLAILRDGRLAAAPDTKPRPEGGPRNRVSKDGPRRGRCHWPSFETAAPSSAASSGRGQLLFHSAVARRRRLRNSEIRFVGGGSAVIDRHAIAFLADDLGHTPAPPRDVVVKPGALPRLHEGVRVLRRHMDFELLAALDQANAFYDVQLFGVRCAEIVGKGLVVHADRVDHEGVAFVMAGGFSVVGGFGIGGMGHVQIDVPRKPVGFTDDHHLLGGLYEEERPARVPDRRNAVGPAG